MNKTKLFYFSIMFIFILNNIATSQEYFYYSSKGEKIYIYPYFKKILIKFEDVSYNKKEYMKDKILARGLPIKLNNISYGDSIFNTCKIDVINGIDSNQFKLLVNNIRSIKGIVSVNPYYKLNKNNNKPSSILGFTNSSFALTKVL